MVIKNCNFSIGEIVYFTLEGINDEKYMMPFTNPPKQFKLNTEYVVRDIHRYANGWHLYIDGSSQFIEEKYFKKINENG